MDKLQSEMDGLSISNKCEDILSLNKNKQLLMKCAKCEECYPQLQQTQDSPSPTVTADSSSVVTAREITNTNARSLCMKVEVERDPGRNPSGSRCVVPQGNLFAQDGSVVCADKITGANISGDIDMSVSIKPSRFHPGGADHGTEFPPEGPAVQMIRENKVKLINCLMADLFILQHAHARRIINDRQYQNLKKLPEPEKTVTDLIDHVIGRGEETCAEFLQVLREDEVLQTYPQLRGILGC